MATIDQLHNRMNGLLKSVSQQNAPHIIHCAGARDEVLARLGAQSEKTPAGGVCEQMSPDCMERFKAHLSQMVADTEQAYHVRMP